MKILHTVRVPLLTLVLLTLLMMTSSAFAASPSAQKATNQTTANKVFSSYKGSYMDSAAGGCMYDHMSQSVAVDPED